MSIKWYWMAVIVALIIVGTLFLPVNPALKAIVLFMFVPTFFVIISENLKNTTKYNIVNAVRYLSATIGFFVAIMNLPTALYHLGLTDYISFGVTPPDKSLYIGLSALFKILILTSLGLYATLGYSLEREKTQRELDRLSKANKHKEPSASKRRENSADDNPSIRNKVHDNYTNELNNIKQQMRKTSPGHRAILGVGGAGLATINRLKQHQTPTGTFFLAIDTDENSLRHSLADVKIPYNTSLRANYLRVTDELRRLKIDAAVVVVGAGGGIGYEAVSNIALQAKQLGINISCITFTPFAFEDNNKQQASKLFTKLASRKFNQFAIISNNELLDTADEKHGVKEAFAAGDNIIRTAFESQ